MITREQLLTPGARFRVVKNEESNVRDKALGKTAVLSHDDGTELPYFRIEGEDGDRPLWLDELDLIEPEPLAVAAAPAPEPQQDALTLRDQFAMAALTGLLAGDRYWKPADAAPRAFEIADYMLTERAKVRS